MDPSAAYEVLLYVSVVVFGAMLMLYLRSGRASMFHPVTVYMAFHAVTFVVRPLLAYYLDYHELYIAYGFNPSISDKITVVLGANLGFVVFTLAGLWFGRAKPRLDSISDSQRLQYVVPLLLTCVICGLPGIWSMTRLYGAAGSEWADQLRLDTATGITINTATNGYLIDAQNMLAMLVGLIAYLFRFRLWSLLPFALFVIARAGTGGRGPFIAAIFFMMLLYLFHHRRRWMTAMTVALGTLAVALYRIVGDYRVVGFQAMAEGSGPGEHIERLRFLESMDFANLEFFEYVVYVVPQRSGTYDYFLSLLGVFTEPIPRILWEDKPIGAPIRLFNMWDYGSPIGMTYSLPGSGWMELGWVGIVIMCAAFAWLYGKAHDRFMNGRKTPFSVMLYCAFAVTLVVAVRDGSVVTIAKQSLFYLAPVVVMQLFAMAYARGGVGSAGVPALAPSPRPQAKAQTPQERRRSRAAGIELA